MASVDITIPGEPVPFARAGSNGKIRFTPPKQRDYMAATKYFAAAAMGKASLKPFAGPVRMTIVATYLAPGSWSDAKRRATMYRTSRPDVDNLTKLVSDALNGIAYVDDAQVVELLASKLYGERSEIFVRVSEV